MLTVLCTTHTRISEEERRGPVCFQCIGKNLDDVMGICSVVFAQRLRGVISVRLQHRRQRPYAPEDVPKVVFWLQL